MKAAVAFKTLAHVLGDPIDYTYTRLSLIAAWEECLDLSRSQCGDDKPGDANARNIAIILMAFERVFDHVKDREQAERYFKAIVLDFRSPENETIGPKNYEDIARRFIVIQTRQLGPAIFSIGFYAWQVIGAFVPAIGSNPTPSGGRVATALNLSWIIFKILFSNTVGEIALPATYESTIKGCLDSERPKFESLSEKIERSTFDQATEDCVGTTHYTGYCYSLAWHYAEKNVPIGLRSKTRHRWRNPHLLRAFAHTPMFVAIVSAVAVTSLAPTYFSVRHIFFFGVGIMYHIISPALTSYLRPRLGLRAVLTKNAIMALFMTGLFIVNSCGLFYNNCLGRATIFPKGHGVVIYSKRDFDRNDFILFPLITTLCITMQIFISITLSLLYSRCLSIMQLEHSH
jgi:hypothetical protein